jgi:hypothetical protein
MGRLLLLSAMLVMLTMSGCAGDKGKELLETAQFEEKQHNLPHATQLYEEIVRKYPDSDAAKKAEERLTALKAVKSAE